MPPHAEPLRPRRLEFRHLGLTLAQSALVGLAVGAVACVFYLLVQETEHFVLGELTGFHPLRPAGEPAPPGSEHHPTHLWLLLVVPALGALLSGLIARFLAPEVAGGGADGYIRSFHRDNGLMRVRAVPLKIIASVFALGSGGSGGREGPAIMVGAGVGSGLAQALGLEDRERRLLLVAGAAAGMSAIFRTPLGAALLAVEVLYRDDFEADALIPAILASVTAYAAFSVAIPSAGPLFAHASRYPFLPLHLPLYVALAVILALGAMAFLTMLHAVERRTAASPLPAPLRPALGGLGVGLLALTWILTVNPTLNLGQQGPGILGSGYGAVQAAITGADWLPRGWWGVAVLAMLAVLKMGATALTVGTRASAGDFGPSLAIGGLLGGAFGRAMQLMGAPVPDAGAFALVGMGVFYGGMAHAPLGAAVMVCELSSTYDLLVPLMFALGSAFLLLRRFPLYPTQVTTRFRSPAHAGATMVDLLRTLRVGEACTITKELTTVSPTAHVKELVHAITHASEAQDVLPVVTDGKVVGLVSVTTLRDLVDMQDIEELAVTADLMSPPVTVNQDDDLQTALERMLSAELRELPVLDAEGRVAGYIDEADITRAWLRELSVKQRESARDSMIEG
ncbi:MAG: chloride channel protein [Polyangiales bacterium]